MKFNMLSLLIVLYALCGIQGKAFPSRYKRNYEGSYHYIPYEEGVVRLPAGYSPENYPSYEDFVHGYVQTNGRDWPVYYRPPVPSQQIKDPYSNVNGHHKIKTEHNWHFINQNHVPRTLYMDGRHQLESDVEAPNVIEALVKKEVIDGHGREYDVPIVVEALARRDNVDQEDSDIPILVDPLTIKQNLINYEYGELPVVSDSSIKHKGVYDEHEGKVSNLASLTEKRKLSSVYKPVKIGSVVAYDAFGLPVEVDSLNKKEMQAVSYDIYEPKKDKPTKIQFLSSNESELTVKEDFLDEEDDLGNIEPITSDDAFDFSGVDSLCKKEKQSKIEPVTPYYTLDHRDNVNSLYKKNKPVTAEPAAPYYTLKPEKPVKEKPVKEKPEKPIKEKPISFDAFDYPLEFLNEVDDHEAPIVVEALVRKEPTFQKEGEYEAPVVVEALIQKHPVYENETNTKEYKIFPKELLNSGIEYILTGDLKNFTISVEAPSFEQDIESNEASKEESIGFDEMQGFKEPDTDGFDEIGDNGSAMDFDGSDIFRSSLPVNSNEFSVVANIEEKERTKFESCVTTTNEIGNCMPLQLCSVSNSVSNRDKLLGNVCIIDEVFLGVCCPEFPVETVRVDWEQLKLGQEMLKEDKSQLPKECGKMPEMVTDRDPWPWMAFLVARSSEKIFCGGALVSEQYVLTAAHCTIRIPHNQILVRLGRPSKNAPEQDFEVIEIKRHAGYNSRTMQNDIALLKLSRRVPSGEFRQVCLDEHEEDISGLVSESASLLRWKATPGQIKDVEQLSVISNRECQNRMKTSIADSLICTEPRTDKTMCNADSGAPLVIENDKFEVIGILTSNRSDCDEHLPTVFTRVSSYHRWIEKLAS